MRCGMEGEVGANGSMRGEGGRGVDAKQVTASQVLTGGFRGMGMVVTIEAVPGDPVSLAAAAL